MPTITREWLEQHRSDRGGVITKDQASAIGVSWPLVAGWKHAAIGRQITDEAKARFEQALRSRQARASSTLDLFG
jgi:hypothetical protein